MKYSRTLVVAPLEKSYKVRNKVDGHVYAMKQVSDFTKHVALREVQVLSSIDHEHVVRYYGAWVEKGEELMREC